MPRASSVSGWPESRNQSPILHGSSQVACAQRSWRAFDIPWPRNSWTTKTPIKYANTAQSDTTRANATCCPSRYAAKQREFSIDRSTTLRRRPLAQYDVCRNSYTRSISRRARPVEISTSAPTFQFLRVLPAAFDLRHEHEASIASRGRSRVQVGLDAWKHAVR